MRFFKGSLYWWFRNPAITSWYGQYPTILPRFWTSKRRFFSPDFWTINRYKPNPNKQHYYEGKSRNTLAFFWSPHKNWSYLIPVVFRIEKMWPKQKTLRIHGTGIFIPISTIEINHSCGQIGSFSQGFFGENKHVYLKPPPTAILGGEEDRSTTYPLFFACLCCGCRLCCLPFL